MQTTLRSRLASLFRDALALHLFSGASVLVASRHGVIFEEVYGATGFGPGSPAITPGTWFDLASLTKPLVTASLAMMSVTRGWLDLEASLEDVLHRRSVPDDKRRLTMRQLLNHCSGLPAYRSYFRDLMEVPATDRPATLLNWILEEPLLGPPQTLHAYSDLGFMVLTDILQYELGMRLDQAASNFLFDPLQIKDLGYCPVPSDGAPQDPQSAPEASPAAVFAQTEWCPWRSRLLAGEVHDENAFALGGVAGHAGLFGTARAIHDLLTFLWQLHHGATHSDWIDPAVVREFWTRQNLVADSTWALGFDTPSAVESSAGERFSPHSVGHLGFTGTSFWLDLDQEVLIILLTNRVHPDRNRSTIKTFRPQAHNLIMEALYAS